MRVASQVRPGASVAPVGEGEPQAKARAEVEDYQHQEEDGLHLQGEEQPKVQVKRAPGELAAEERAEHEALHERYRALCRACVAGRGRRGMLMRE